MSFFDEPPEDEAPEPEPRYRTPGWAGPAEDVIPATVPVDVVLARTDEALVWLGGVTAYDEGFAFDLMTVSRRADTVDPFELYERWRREGETLRFGVLFADGRKAVDARYGGPGADGVVLSPMGGGGGQGTWTQSHWVHPLPPPGPLTFVCAWPRFGIGETRTEVDAALVLDAARRAFVVWPDDRPPLPPDDADFQHIR